MIFVMRNKQLLEIFKIIGPFITDVFPPLMEKNNLNNLLIKRHTFSNGLSNCINLSNG